MGSGLYPRSLVCSVGKETQIRICPPQAWRQASAGRGRHQFGGQLSALRNADAFSRLSGLQGALTPLVCLSDLRVGGGNLDSDRAAAANKKSIGRRRVSA